ncbi:uncharacterized protein BP5553_02458 [Venustampulla echinocandica]|uniref:HMG box domain-containing protein n=1 Tax=Venustampulla echinocandica TaxID=2656787 RepID=A0A370U3X8_9HELO|nr:uncharacterized protein BP5553_02458 [Venustampulla echinocandica]RDL42479.1 hypothetical protein BP5553_02458 [Venustampulla echinocandica]
MAKGKKAVEAPKEGKQITLNLDTFMLARDSVVANLNDLQDTIKTLASGIQTLSTNYIRHTNVVLGDHSTDAEIDSSLSKLTDISALLGRHQRADSPEKPVAAADTAADKKERKKRQHDPNAPKRPLTPFFLYMQTARPIITQDLGPGVAKGIVAAEGTRRWSTMDADDKQLWSNAYKDNLRLYNARVHSYRNGNIEAKDMSEDEALTYAERNNIGADTSADAQLVGEASATALHDDDAEGEPEKSPTPAPKTPKAKASRKSKGAKDTPAQASETIVPGSASIVPPKAAAPEKEKSPEKKRKRGAKKDAVEEPAAEKEETSTPKSAPKSRKKKAKTDA